MANIYKILTKIMVATLMYYVSENGVGGRKTSMYKPPQSNESEKTKMHDQFS